METRFRAGKSRGLVRHMHAANGGEDGVCRISRAGTEARARLTAAPDAAARSLRVDAMPASIQESCQPTVNYAS
jgi:hypothetical protein